MSLQLLKRLISGVIFVCCGDDDSVDEYSGWFYQ